MATIKITNNATIPGCKKGTAFSLTLTATGGTGTATWSIVSGALPAGLTLDATSGIISGTPTVDGNFAFKAKVDYGTPGSDEKDFTLKVDPATTISITNNATMPVGKKGTAFSQTLTATGGTGTATWSIVSGALPAGLTLNATSGVISGTPTVDGTFAFKAKVDYGTHGSATKDFTLKVDPAAAKKNTWVIPAIIIAAVFCIAAIFAIRPLWVAYLNSTPATSEKVCTQVDAKNLGFETKDFSLKAGSDPDTVLSRDGNTIYDLSCTDVNGAASLTISVHGAGAGSDVKVEIDSSLSYSLKVGEILSNSVPTTTGGTPPYSYTLKGNGGAAWLGLDANGKFSGKATDAGEYKVTIEAKDANGITGPGTVMIVVKAADGSAPAPAGNGNGNGANGNGSGTDASSCGVTNLSEGEPFKWQTNLTVGGDLKMTTAMMVADGDLKLAIIAHAGKSGDLGGASMNGRLWQMNGTDDQIACFLNTFIDGNTKVEKWLISDGKVDGWSNNPPTDWTAAQNPDEAAISGLVNPSGVVWDETPMAIDATHSTIGGDEYAYRCEPWKPSMGGWSWDVLIAPHSDVKFDTTIWQGQCWKASGVTSTNMTDLFKLAEQRTLQHETRMIAGNAFNGMNLLYVGPDKSIMPSTLFETNLKVETGSWIYAPENTPDGWTISK